MKCAAAVLTALLAACASLAGEQLAFTFQLPIRAEDLGENSFGLNSFGAHIGDHGIDGHPGWDIEYRPGASAYAAAAGLVRSVVSNPDGRNTVQIEHSVNGQLFRTVYTNLEEVDAAVSAGVAVTAGQRLGRPGSNSSMVGTVTQTWASIHFQLDDFTVNHGLTNPMAVSPEPHLNAAGRALFDEIWSRAAYRQEVCEPFPSNPRSVAFPLTRAWTGSGTRLEFTCMGATSPLFRYAIYDGAGTLSEAGNLELQSVSPAFTAMDFRPDAGGTRRALLRIVSETMLLDLPAAGAPRAAGLANARVYTTPANRLAAVSAATWASGSAAPDSIVAAFATGLAVDTAQAPPAGSTWTLAGTRAMVRDNAGVTRTVPLLFVSPGQVNLVTPGDTPDGPAVLMISSAEGTVYTGAIEVARVVPGLFAAVRDGEFLTLYGTGLRRRGKLEDVRVLVAGEAATVTYAGPQPQFPGLDQINARLTALPARRGSVDVIVTVEGKAANTLTIEIP